MTDQCSTCSFYVAPQCRQKAPGNQVPGRASAAGLEVTPDYWCGDGIGSGDGHYFSTKLNQGPQGPQGPAYSFAPGTATAVAGAVTLNTLAGEITSEALVAAASYSLTLIDSSILTTSIVLWNVFDAAGVSLASLKSRSVIAGQTVLTVAISPALTGTLKFNFAVFN